MDKKLTAFLPTVNPGKAKEFYQNVMGLVFLSEDGHGLEFDSNGTTLRVTLVQSFIPHPFTVLGWDVENINSSVIELAKKGVLFEKYDFLKQDEVGVWTAPGGTQVAWFKDPDGNLLSLSQHV